MSAIDVFLTCHQAIRAGQLIQRASGRDKEFHFQDWFTRRLEDCGLRSDPPSRNSYPDFRLVESPIGFETKGLTFPGREANYDCNSQPPSGVHNGRRIYYVFGRYPQETARAFPVYDLVICDGDFLNADHDYTHKNRNVKGFGSYGDLMIRDRKMYVAPTPFALTEGTAGQITLILKADEAVDTRLRRVGEMERCETAQHVIGYAFDLRHNDLTPRFAANPAAGVAHRFRAYRAALDTGPAVSLRPATAEDAERDD